LWSQRADEPLTFRARDRAIRCRGRLRDRVRWTVDGVRCDRATRVECGADVIALGRAAIYNPDWPIAARARLTHAMEGLRFVSVHYLYGCCPWAPMRPHEREGTVRAYAQYGRASSVDGTPCS